MNALEMYAGDAERRAGTELDDSCGLQRLQGDTSRIGNPSLQHDPGGCRHSTGGARTFQAASADLAGIREYGVGLRSLKLDTRKRPIASLV